MNSAVPCTPWNQRQVPNSTAKDNFVMTNDEAGTKNDGLWSRSPAAWHSDRGISELKTVNYVLQMMNYVFKMMNYVSQMMSYVLKMMNSVFKMMNFVFKNDELCIEK